jgi:hypothetical protein
MGDTFQKMTKAKRAGNVAQVVEWRPSKHNALSSNSNTAQKRDEV